MREDAAIGIFISLESIKKTMMIEAANAGGHNAGVDRKYAKIQLYTVEELLMGAKRAEIPGYQTTFACAKPAESENGNQLNLL
jgi:site-specific DNA-methyltransferase (adenine-specific)